MHLTESFEVMRPRDDVVDPAMQDSSSWDPSGIRRMGRFHVVDATNQRLHMFSSVGKYVSSYPGDSVLVRPAGIAIVGVPPG